MERCSDRLRSAGIVHALAAAGVGVATAVATAGPVIVPQAKTGEPLAGLTAGELLRFDEGRIAYLRPFLVGEGLGPVFNDNSCGVCHDNPVGGTGSTTVTRFGQAGKGTFDPLADLGGSLLQAQSISAGCMEIVPPEANVQAFRVTNGAMGYGLIEAIEDADLLALEQPTPGISGRAHIVPVLESPPDTAVGRFGWKAQLATILSFSADASNNEMGMTNRILGNEQDPNGTEPPSLGAPDHCDTIPDPEDNTIIGNGMEFIDRVTDFQRFLTQPPQTPKSGMTGETVFNTIGCNQCHWPSFVTSSDMSLEDAIRNKTIRPYSDFLLHDMGLAADSIVQGDASGREIRTPVLWGVRMRDPVWHDGGVGGGTFESRMTAAIQNHGATGSEALDAGVFAAWQALTPLEKSQLVQFLDSLGRAEFDADGDNVIDRGTDFVDFSACFFGVMPGTVSPDDPCAVHDIEPDGDVDFDDYASFLLAYEGPQEDCNNNGQLDLTDILDLTSADVNADGVPDECQCPSDVTGENPGDPPDGTVNVFDLQLILAQFGTSGPEGDITGPNPGDPPDGTVNVFDLLKVLGDFGLDCPTETP